MGVSGVVVLYALQWSLAPFAYIQWSNVEVATRAYPVFQALSSAMGIAAFGLLGILSRRFRLTASEKIGISVIYTLSKISRADKLFLVTETVF